jgi:hypothetical protein
MPDYHPLHRYEHFSVALYAAASVPVNHRDAYCHLWQTLLPRYAYSFWSTCLACEVTRFLVEACKRKH